MKLTMLKCIEALNGFSKLSNCELPFKQGYVIAQNIKKLEAVVAPFEEKRNEFIKDLQSKAYDDEDGNKVVPDEAADVFRDDVQELLKEEIEVQVKKVNMYGVEAEGVKPLELKGCVDFIEIKE
jgi:hypothetical protein